MTSSSACKARFAVGLAGLAVVSVIVWWTLWAAIAPPLFGWSPVAMTSGSMEPHIGTGDIVFVSPSDGQDLAPGTVIVFDDRSGGRVTHRIVDITPDGAYVTRGDASGRIDSTPVAPDDVRGVGRMVIPLIGQPIVWLDDGRWLLLGVATVLTAASAWASRWALLRRFNPWCSAARVPSAPKGPPRLGGRLPSGAGVLTVAIVACTIIAATATKTRAAFAGATDNTAGSVIADTLEPPPAMAATGGGTVTIDWKPTPDTSALGHRVFRATTPGGPYVQIAQTTPRTVASYVDSPAPGTYYYVVRAYTATWESVGTAEDSATVTSVGLAGPWQSGLTHVAGAGADRLLVFVASNEQQATSTPSLTGVTYGGQPLTPAMTDEVGNLCCTVRAEIWVLDEAGIAAAVGTTITPTWTSAPDTPLYSHVVFRNVDQVTPIGDTASASMMGDAPNPVPMSSVTTSVGDVVVAAATAGEAGTYTPQNGFALGLNQDTTVGGTTAQGTGLKRANGVPETVSMLFNPASPPWINRQIALAMVLNVTP